MAMRSLLPWRVAPMTAGAPTFSVDRELDALQRQMNQLFADFFGEGRMMPRRAMMQPEATGFMPAVEVREADSKIEVFAELPGMSENDIEVTLSPDATTLTITGEKKLVQEDKGETYYECERTYGSFRRDVLLPAIVKADAIEARFHHGVLEIDLEKAEEGEAARSIPIQVKSQEG